jgi:hypothetical protein
MTDHGLPPVPPDDGPSHTHNGRLEVAAGLDLNGQWRVVVLITADGMVPAGHRIAASFTVDEADKLVTAVLQAQGDIRTGRL